MRDYIALTKPRVTWLILATTGIGYFFGARFGWTWWTLFHTIAGTGLMASGTASDARMTAYGITSSGLTTPDQNFYKSIHTPVKILLGGSGDIAYTNGERDYTNISALGMPIILFSKGGAGHGGDLTARHGGDFTKVNLAWLNWQLKDDTTATGKGFLVGDTCTFCSSSSWESKSANIP